MHLARLRLNSGNGQARRDLSNPYETHRSLVRAFVNGEKDIPTRFLWRLQLDGMWANPEILVQSVQRGNWSVLENLPGYLARSTESKEIPLETWLQERRLYRFRLRANPTVCRNGKRLGLVGEEAQLEWLQKQGPRYGFRVGSSLLTASEVMTASKDGRLVTLRTATYEGVMECLNTELLESALLQGIGRGKAFGLGLLSLAPVGMK